MVFSILLPAFREAESLKKLIPEICNVSKSYEIEVIVIDDDSRDGTESVVKNLQEQGLPVKIIVRKEDKGFAKSIRCGIENASGKFIVVMDSDGNHDPVYLPFMFESTKFYDCVTASRFQYGGGMNSKWRQLLSWLFNIYVRAMTGGFITDSLYGYFVIKRESLARLNFDKIFWGYGDYGIRLFYYLQKNREEILQFPAQNARRISGEGNSRFFMVFVKYFVACVNLVISERVFNGRKNY